MLQIQVAAAPDGTPTYAIPGPPAALPEVSPAALLAAWEAARLAAANGHWGAPRLLLFRTESGAMRIALTDRDACCWAEAVDRLQDLGTARGLALCLRLLALIDAMGRAPDLSGLFEVTGDGVVLHPALLRAAARLPLDGAARFDVPALCRALPRRLSQPPKPPLNATGRKDPAKMRPLFVALMLLPVVACARPPVESTPDRTRTDACRAEATRLVQWRDRGQLMRTDEAESSRGTFGATPFSRLESDRLGQQFERDRLAAECLRRPESAPLPAGR
jgi:hypothetical protein